MKAGRTKPWADEPKYRLFPLSDSHAVCDQLVREGGTGGTGGTAERKWVSRGGTAGGTAWYRQAADESSTALYPAQYHLFQDFPSRVPRTELPVPTQRRTALSDVTGFCSSPVWELVLRSSLQRQGTEKLTTRQPQAKVSLWGFLAPLPKPCWNIRVKASWNCSGL